LKGEGDSLKLADQRHSSLNAIILTGDSRKSTQLGRSDLLEAADRIAPAG